MKLLHLIIAFIFISCNDARPISENETQQMKIQLSDLSDEHSNKKQMEYLLNNYKENFLPCESTLDSLKKASLIQNQFCFKTPSSNVILNLIFCAHQNDALEIADANLVDDSTSQKWGVNGSVLIIVQGKEESEVNDVSSHFAGEE